jgi:hypothetical protein
MYPIYLCLFCLFLFFIFYLFWDRASLCCPGWSLTPGLKWFSHPNFLISRDCRCTVFREELRCIGQVFCGLSDFFSPGSTGVLGVSRRVESMELRYLSRHITWVHAVVIYIIDANLYHLVKVVFARLLHCKVTFFFSFFFFLWYSGPHTCRKVIYHLSHAISPTFLCLGGRGWDCHLNLWLCACKVVTLLLEPHFQSILLWLLLLFFEVFLFVCLVGWFFLQYWSLNSGPHAC